MTSEQEYIRALSERMRLMRLDAELREWVGVGQGVLEEAQQADHEAASVCVGDAVAEAVEGRVRK